LNMAQQSAKKHLQAGVQAMTVSHLQQRRHKVGHCSDYGTQRFSADIQGMLSGLHSLDAAAAAAAAEEPPPLAAAAAAAAALPPEAAALAAAEELPPPP
jgi:hypothetical protein